MKLKGIHIQVPFDEYVKFKTFAAAADISLQMLIRTSVNRFMAEEKKKAYQKRNSEKEKQECE